MYVCELMAGIALKMEGLIGQCDGKTQTEEAVSTIKISSASFWPPNFEEVFWVRRISD